MSDTPRCGGEPGDEAGQALDERRADRTGGPSVQHGPGQCRGRAGTGGRGAYATAGRFGLGRPTRRLRRPVATGGAGGGGSAYAAGTGGVAERPVPNPNGRAFASAKRSSPRRDTSASCASLASGSTVASKCSHASGPGLGTPRERTPEPVREMAHAAEAAGLEETELLRFGAQARRLRQYLHQRRMHPAERLELAPTRAIAGEEDLARAPRELARELQARQDPRRRDQDDFEVPAVG